MLPLSRKGTRNADHKSFMGLKVFCLFHSCVIFNHFMGTFGSKGSAILGSLDSHKHGYHTGTKRCTNPRNWPVHRPSSKSKMFFANFSHDRRIHLPNANTPVILRYLEQLNFKLSKWCHHRCFSTAALTWCLLKMVITPHWLKLAISVKVHFCQSFQLAAASETEHPQSSRLLPRGWMWDGRACFLSEVTHSISRFQCLDDKSHGHSHYWQIQPEIKKKS